MLYREGAEFGRVMAIALHPYLTGVPHRIDASPRRSPISAGTSGCGRRPAPKSRDIISRRSGPHKGADRHGSIAQDGGRGAAGGRRDLRCAGRAGGRDRHRRNRRTPANLWPVFIGLNKGFFAAEDLKVDVVYVQSSAQLVQQITAGSLDICMSTGLVDPMRAIGMGAPIAIVRVEVQAPPYALIAKSSIKSLKELKAR